MDPNIIMKILEPASLYPALAVITSGFLLGTGVGVIADLVKRRRLRSAPVEMSAVISSLSPAPCCADQASS